MLLTRAKYLESTITLTRAPYLDFTLKVARTWISGFTSFANSRRRFGVHRWAGSYPLYGAPQGI